MPIMKKKKISIRYKNLKKENNDLSNRVHALNRDIAVIEHEKDRTED